jgi:hypothetical protein
MFGECKTCKALKEEVQFLRSLVRPKSEPKYNPLPIVQLEQDAIMNGAGEQIIVSSDEQRRQEELDSERAKLLSGEY